MLYCWPITINYIILTINIKSCRLVYLKLRHPEASGKFKDINVCICVVIGILENGGYSIFLYNRQLKGAH